ncbi:MAG: hypothetical protein EOM23_02645 [Candidatus Moranbacteria bacterium]|nr:hypothetical protein [Candidatus Moranbacteria bacterium]
MSVESLHPIDCPHARQGSYLNTTNSKNPGKTIYCDRYFELCYYARFLDNPTAIINTRECPLRKDDSKEDTQGKSQTIVKLTDNPEGYDLC